MTERVTRCPSCQVAFRVSGTQLRAANGKVRCGACFRIFDAPENFTDVPSLGPKAAPRVRDDQSHAPATGLAGDDFADTGFPAIALFGTDDSEDDDWAEQVARPTAAPPPERPSIAPESAGAGEDYINGAGPLDPEAFSAPPAAKVPAEPLRLPTEGTLAEETGHSGETAQEPSETKTAGIGELPETVNAPVDILPLTPAGELPEEAPPAPGDRRRQWRWLAVAATALLLLGFQWVYFNIDRLAMDPGYRTALSVFCRATGCTLPPLADKTQIDAARLAVRSHPERRGVLLVDATLVNRAGFDQPFPPLTLTFRDLQGRVVAKRTFAPEEYLWGEAQGVKAMPRGQPVKLELEIVDPGEEATSYALTLD